ncbi:MAG: hypothetical protein JOZ98_04280 [Solirubrobacterales bacterium]|nr:hypothetical protein [Solirubrobacterales bacterium]
MLIVLGSALLQRLARGADRAARGADPRARSGSLFSSPAYRRVVALEVIALVGGGVLLGSTGHGEYTIAWFAGVVGFTLSASDDCSGLASTGSVAHYSQPGSRGRSWASRVVGQARSERFRG